MLFEVLSVLLIPLKYFRSNRRNNERSGVISRRVDSDPLLEFVEKHVENSVRSHKGIGGGFQVRMIAD